MLNQLSVETGAAHYVPLTFYREAVGKPDPLRTSACLKVTEITHAQPNWWEMRIDQGTPAERALKSVVDAMKRNDRMTLYKLSDSAQGRDPRQFDSQAQLSFELLKKVKLAEITHTYAFDNLLVFFAKLRMGDRFGGGRFVFVRQANGEYGFLPYATKEPTFLNFQQWVTAPWGLQAEDRPNYCTEETIKRATHRIALAAPTTGDAADVWQPSYLYLTGTAFDGPGKNADLVVRMMSVIQAIKAAVAHHDADAFSKQMTAEAAREFQKSLSSLNEQQRRQFWEEAGQKLDPVFLFDTSPVIIVYLRDMAQSADVRSMYFTVSKDGRPLLTNENQITNFDLIFRRGSMLFKMASQPKPFDDIKIK